LNRHKKIAANRLIKRLIVGHFCKCTLKSPFKMAIGGCTVPKSSA
jgi:hypothetical protein